MERMPESHSFSINTKVGDDTLVFDTATRRAVTLNPAAAFVYSHCDGEKSVKQVTELFSQEFPEQANAEEQVLNAIAILQQENLVAGNTVTRRDFLKTAGIVAASIPFAASVIAPPAAAATSKECFSTISTGGDGGTPSDENNCLACGENLPSNYHPFKPDNTPNSNPAFNCCPCTIGGTCANCDQDMFCSINMSVSFTEDAAGNPDNTQYSDWVLDANEPSKDTATGWSCRTVEGASAGNGECGTCKAGCGDAREAATQSLPTQNNRPILSAWGLSNAKEKPSLTYSCCRASACCTGGAGPQ